MNFEEIKKKYNKKISEILKHNENYYDKNNPIISDNDYDELKEHENCVSSYNELAEKNEIVDIKYQGERDFGYYKRFMVIGTW